MSNFLSLAAALLMLALAPADALAQYADEAASSQILTNQRTWQAEDRCNANAWRQYPDYTKEASAKRERAFKICQMSGQYPPRAPLVAAPVPSMDASPPR